jgi:hypothetical protein
MSDENQLRAADLHNKLSTVKTHPAGLMTYL